MLNITVENQEVLEQYLAFLLQTAFPSINPSPECDPIFRSFICMYAFGACDGNLSVLATRASCADVRDRACIREWSVVSDFVGHGALPICENLRDGKLQGIKC